MKSVSLLEFCTGVGLELTPAQRVFVAVAVDRVPLPELDEADRALAVKVFGGEFSPASVIVYAVIVALFGRASGKTSLAGAYLVWRALTADLSRLAPGEIAFGMIVAPDVATGQQTLSFARGLFQRSPALAECVVSETSESVLIRRPSDGRLVSIEVFAASAGGKSLRGRSILGAIFDESAFFRDSSAVVNDVELFQAVLPRLLDGGAIWLPSTPYLRAGLLWQLYEQNWNAPTSAVVAHAPTSLMRTDDPELLARIDAARERDPINAAREFDAEWLPIGSGNVFDAEALNAAIVEHVNRTQHGTISIGGDLGLVNDPTAFVVAQRTTGKIDGEPGDVVKILEVVEFKPRRGQPIELERVVRAADDLCRNYGVRRVRVDHHSLTQAREWATKLKLKIVFEPCREGDARQLRFQRMADLVKRKRLLVPRAYAELAEQLGSLIATPRGGGGFAYSAPRKQGSHADAAMACILACEPLLDASAYEDGLRKIGRTGRAEQLLAGFGRAFGNTPWHVIGSRTRVQYAPTFCAKHNSHLCGCP